MSFLASTTIHWRNRTSPMLLTSCTISLNKIRKEADYSSFSPRSETLCRGNKQHVSSKLSTVSRLKPKRLHQRSRLLCTMAVILWATSSKHQSDMHEGKHLYLPTRTKVGTTQPQTTVPSILSPCHLCNATRRTRRYLQMTWTTRRRATTPWTPSSILLASLAIRIARAAFTTATRLATRRSTSSLCGSGPIPTASQA